MQTDLVLPPIPKLVRSLFEAAFRDRFYTNIISQKCMDSDLAYYPIVAKYWKKQRAPMIEFTRGFRAGFGCGCLYTLDRLKLELAEKARLAALPAKQQLSSRRATRA